MKLFGKAEKMPETLAELTELCPELIAQAKQEAVQSVNVEAVTKEAVDAALSAERTNHAAELERLKGIMTAALGEEIAGRINAIFTSGVTGEQYAAIGAPLIVPGTDSEAERKKKEEILAALKQTGKDNPGHDTQGVQSSSFREEGSDPNEAINKAVGAYRKEHPDASERDAFLAVAKTNPELFRDR